jgi:hypothetical protein
MARQRDLRTSRLCVLLALALWAGYALPLFAPPATVCAPLVSGDAGLLARVLPGVPASWILSRLVCVLAAAGIVAGGAWRWVPRRVPVHVGSVPAIGVAVWVALVFAAALAATGVFAESLERGAQLAYIAGLFVPALVLVIAYPPRRARVDAWSIAVLALAVAWAVARLVLAWNSPRSADAVDTLTGASMLEETENAGLNILTHGPLVGASHLFLVFHGLGLYGPAGVLTRSLHTLQVLNVLWTAVAAVALGSIAARVIGRPAAPIAAAALLFSPLMLLGPLVSIPMYHGVLIAALLALLWMAIHAHRSPPAVAAFGALAGVGFGHPNTLLVTVAACGAALWSACRRPRMPRPLIALGVLTWVAAVYPGLPAPSTLRSMQQSFTRGTRPWDALEPAVLGQLDPALSHAPVDEPPPRSLDLVVGTLLAPIAIPRTALRLWGDALFEPVGAALGLCGVLACLLAWRRSCLARVLLAALVIALLPGVVSSYDRVSLTRITLLGCALPLFAALGFELIVRWTAVSARAAAAAAVAAIAIGGMLLFDVVNPRILPASAFGIALEALGSSPTDDVAFLDYSEWEFAWLGRVRQIGAIIRPQPIRVVRYGGRESLAALTAADHVPEIVFWTPGLERYRSIADHVCARWPRARVFTLRDRPGCSRVYAAVLNGRDWQPALAADRWTAQPCSR